MFEKTSYPAIESTRFKKLGTTIDIRIVVRDEKSSEKAAEDLAELGDFFAMMEKKFSRFDPKSELSILNRNLGKKMEASKEMEEIIRRCLEYNEKTRGFFDPRVIETLECIGYDRNFESLTSAKETTVNCNFKITKNLDEELLIDERKAGFLKRMDFSGVVKGYATDRAAGILRAKGWKDFFVDSGGDMFFAGKNEKGEPWLVDVEGIPAGKLILELCEKGIATSGIGKRKWEHDGKRFHHLINPKNMQSFSFELQSATVIADSTEQADIWAKTLFLLGKEEARRWVKEKHLACVILEYSGRAWVSPYMKKYSYKKL